MNKLKILQLLGLARRAGKVIYGEDLVLKNIKEKKIKIVFIANDASEKQKDMFLKKCYFYQVETNTFFSTNELSHAIGVSMCKYLGVTDEGFFKALQKELNGGAVNEGKGNFGNIEGS